RTTEYQPRLADRAFKQRGVTMKTDTERNKELHALGARRFEEAILDFDKLPAPLKQQAARMLWRKLLRQPWIRQGREL
ncbi:MAG: hypothetical protein WA669_16800, partial [Pseudolabrys sp.]